MASDTDDHFSPLGLWFLACLIGGSIFPRDVLGLEHWAWSVLGIVGGVVVCLVTSMLAVTVHVLLLGGRTK